MDILAIQNLKKKFGSKEVLCGLDMSVPEHSIFGFIGKNGAGKTTTMKAILGLLKADSGEIYVMGEKVRFGQTNTNRHIGYLPDVPEFYSYMTPYEYLTLCGEVCGMDKADIVTRSKELLELVGLGQEHHRIKGFSRGSQHLIQQAARKFWIYFLQQKNRPRYFFLHTFFQMWNVSALR